jgi:hypothetical protein
MTQNHNFGFKSRSRLEAVAQHADEKQGNCDHQPQLCCDSPTAATPPDEVFGSDKDGSRLAIPCEASFTSHFPGMKPYDTTGCGARMSEAQAVKLKELSEAAFEREAFKPNLDAAEAARRIAALKAKLPLMDGPPHTL